MLRRRKGRPTGAPDHDAHEHEDDDEDEDEDDMVHDLASRLDAVTAPAHQEPHTIPTGRHRRNDPPPPPPEPPRERSFSETFTTESLFIGAQDDPSEYSEGGAPLDSRPYYDPENPWDVLGIPTTADWKTIVVAHRKLAIRYHPDRLHDLPEDERAGAEEHMRDINVAYTTLQRLHDKH